MRLKNNLLRPVVFLLLAVFSIQNCAIADVISMCNKDKLAPPSIFTTYDSSTSSATSKKTVMSEIGLLSVVFSIGDYLLANSGNIRMLGRVIRSKFKDSPSFLTGIDLMHVLMRGKIVHIPYILDDQNYEIQICDKNIIHSLESKGSRWVISGRWAVQATAAKTGIDNGDAADNEESPGYAASLTGSIMNESENRNFSSAIRRLIRKQRARSLFGLKAPKVAGDVEILPVESSEPFYLAIMGLKDRILSYVPSDEVSADEKSSGLDIILVDDEPADFPSYLIFHPGNKREQAYVSKRYFDVLSDVYGELEAQEQEKLVGLILEEFQHENEHIRQYKSILGSRGPPSEAEVDNIAPSFRARALFRIVYVIQKADINDRQERKTILKEFLKNVSTEKSSYIYGFLNFNLEQHLDIARALLMEGKKTEIDVILAQHHLGFVFNHSEIDSKEFREAKDILVKGGAIDIGPKTGKAFPVWKFIRELIRQNILIESRLPISDLNVRARSFEQYANYRRGTQRKPGDSVLYPIPAQTTAIPVDKKTVIRKIMDIQELDNGQKTEIIDSLKFGENCTIIPYEALELIGKSMLSQCTVCRSAGGKGTRYAEVEYDNSGNRIVMDKAKGVYEIPIDGGKSILELAIAQIYGMNRSERSGIEMNVYTSHFTHEDICEELRRLGYEEKLTARIFHTGVYVHPEKPQGAPIIHVIETRKASLYDARTGDFMRNVDASISGTEGYWPDAHDSTFIDYITSGRAYESVISGKRYKFTCNIDNMAAVPDKIILAILKLTGSAIIEEGIVNMGDVGGMNAKRVENGNGGVEILEKDEFTKAMVKTLSEDRAMIMKYFPLFNSANYTEDTVELVRDIFLKGTEDSKVIEWLKAFYDARQNAELLAQLRFNAEYQYRLQTQRWERDKRYPNALQPSNLAGTWFNIAGKKIVVEAPAKTNKYTRFEPLKENINNFKREKRFALLLKKSNTLETPLEEIRLPEELATLKYINWLLDIKAAYRGKNYTLGDLIEHLEKSIVLIEESLARVEEKGSRVYFSETTKKKRIVKGSPGECLRTFYEYFKNRPVDFVTIVAKRTKESGKSFSATTVRKELEVLETLHLIYVDKSKDACSYRLSPAFNILNKSHVGQLQNELNFYDIPKDEPDLHGKIWRIIYAAMSSPVVVAAQSAAINKIDMEFIPTFPENRTLVHIIPVSLIPQGTIDNKYNQRARIIEFINQINSIPNVREKIRIITERQDLAAAVQEEIAMNPNVVIDAALDDVAYLEKLPNGVKALVFKPENNQAENFRQFEGIIASLRALHIKDYSRRMAALSALYELMTGKPAPIIPQTDDTKEFARQFQITLPPITVKEYDDLKSLNESLMRLMESA